MELTLKKGLVIAATALAIAAGFLMLRPLPIISPVAQTPASVPAATVSLPWPAYGQSALGAQNFGVLSTNGDQTAVPMASVAKVVTALAVLKQKPLEAGSQGPTITLGATDVAAYQTYASQGGSVVYVTDGEQISEYQALQAMLLPSANNMAQSLAVWAFGSMDAYLAYANQYVKDLGMAQTHLADAAGFDNASVSSAQDLVKLGLSALNNQVLAQVVNQTEASVPVAGTIHSTNWLLGTDGIIGIKTGNTDKAGGCYLFAANRTIGSQTVTLVGAIMGAADLNQAIADSKALILASDSGFEVATAVQAHQTVGYYNVPWAGKVTASAKAAVNVLRWKTQAINVQETITGLRASAKAGQRVGSITAISNNQPVAAQIVLDQIVQKPSWSWRLTHF